MELARRGQTPPIAPFHVRANVPHCALTRVPYPVRSVQPGVTSDRLYRARDANPEAQSDGPRQFTAWPVQHRCRVYILRAAPRPPGGAATCAGASSANCSCVSLRSCRIALSRIPNCRRRDSAILGLAMLPRQS